VTLEIKIIIALIIINSLIGLIFLLLKLRFTGEWTRNFTAEWIKTIHIISAILLLPVTLNLIVLIDILIKRRKIPRTIGWVFFVLGGLPLMQTIWYSSAKVHVLNSDLDEYWESIGGWQA